MIKVCDAIMGAGKSSAAINYMNSHRGDKFIYVTPYLTEASRIANECWQLDFVEPKARYEHLTQAERDKIENMEDEESYDGRAFRIVGKVDHTAELVKSGRNITTTHQAFLFYTEELLEDIRKHKYTLIIDEDIQTLKVFDAYRDDIDVLIESGRMVLEDDTYKLVRRPDKRVPSSLKHIYRLMESRDLVQSAVGEKKIITMFWSMPAKLLQAFQDVYILTYMFEGQALHNLLRLNGMDYTMIGVCHDANGYHFTDGEGDVPAYTRDLIKKIHILEDKKMNRIGEYTFAYSSNWQKREENQAAMDQTRKHLHNWFTKRNNVPLNQRLWTSFKVGKNKLSGDGYARRFIVVNQKATNDYADCNVLAFVANIFMSPTFTTYYRQHGYEVNEEQYALSVMVQWIFRSAIRKGEDVWLYIPSRRMRDMLKRWLRSLASPATNREGGGADEEEEAVAL